MCVCVCFSPPIFSHKNKKRRRKIKEKSPQNIVARSKGDVASLKIDEPFKIREKRNFFSSLHIRPFIQPFFHSTSFRVGGTLKVVEKVFFEGQILWCGVCVLWGKLTGTRLQGLQKKKNLPSSSTSSSSLFSNVSSKLFLLSFFYFFLSSFCLADAMASIYFNNPPAS